MPDPRSEYDYVAVSSAGKKLKGRIASASEQEAFVDLRAQGLSPLSIKLAKGKSTSSVHMPKSRAPSGWFKRDISDANLALLLANLAALLKAGADIRTSLSILGEKTSDRAVGAFASNLASDISGGIAVDQALETHLTKPRRFIAALAAAGQASGNLAGGIERAGKILETRSKIKEQLFSAVSYPAFVFASAVVSILVILLFIVPALAPIAEDNGQTPPLSLAVMIAASDFLRADGWLVLGALLAASAITSLLGVLGFLTAPFDRLFLQGPFAKTVRGIVFGGYALALGSMLSAGAPMTDALSLALRTVRSPLARAKLSQLSAEVRQGVQLSTALGAISIAPPSLGQMCAVGEATGSLGAMLSRAGEIEEAEAIKRMERLGAILGPALIIALGGIIGTLMAGLLMGVSQLGAGALN